MSHDASGATVTLAASVVTAGAPDTAHQIPAAATTASSTDANAAALRRLLILAISALLLYPAQT